MIIGLDQLATFYARDMGGTYNVVLQASVPCRLVQVRGTTNSMETRAELARLRRFLWDPAYTLPAHSQIEVDGERWNVLENSGNEPRGVNGQVHHKSCDVIRSAP